MSTISHIEVERTTSRVLIAQVKDSGDFVFSGHEVLESRDIGDPTAQYAGDLDYMRTVAAEYKDTMLLWLAKEHFKSDSDFEEWLNRKDIPSEFHNVG